MAEPSMQTRDVDTTRRRLLVAFVIASVGVLAPRVRAANAIDVPPASAADWQAVLETMFPHETVDRALYAVPAGALLGAAEKDPGTRELLAAGWQSLNRSAGGSFAAASPEARTRAVAATARTPLFTVLRQTTVFTFYANPTVWEAFGYDGDAWRFGGWLGRGVDTIDWLPDPPTRSVP
jgi:hypothetical protein